VHYEWSVPFGQDRLIPIWIATLAVKQKSRTVHFQRAAQLLEFLQLPKDGIHYRRLIQGFERIFYSAFFFCSDHQVGEATLMERQSFRFVKDTKLWYSESGVPETARPPQPRTENVIVLSEEFWREIQEHPIPVDLAVVKALADSPGNLDLYVWLVWRCWTAKGSVSVPLFGPEALVSQLGISEKLRERDFRRQIVYWIKVIHQLWPECPRAWRKAEEACSFGPSKAARSFPQGRVILIPPIT
jgi:hypothetical protein